MFWHGIFGIFFSLAMITVYQLTSDTTGLTMFSYPAEVYWLMLGATLADTVAVNSFTIAYQSDSSGFVSLIAYVSIIYVVLGDLLIFNESFTLVQIISTATILVVMVIVSFIKTREKNKAEPSEISDEYRRQDSHPH